MIRLALFVLTIAVPFVRGAELPLLGLAHVEIRVSDFEKARAFYSDVVGLEEATDLRIKNEDGSTKLAYFKVNDQQFIEIMPSLKADELVPMTHIAFYTSDVRKTHEMVGKMGLSPTDIRKAPRYGEVFYVKNPPGQKLGVIEFLQYEPDTMQGKTHGKWLGERRLGKHVEHAGIVTTDVDAAYKFYTETLGFHETWRRSDKDTGRVIIIHLRLPGSAVDYVELVNQSGKPNLTRAEAGNSAHFSLGVSDVQEIRRISYQRGMKDDRMQQPRFGRDERWQFNLIDPDGTRIEFMQPRDPARRGIPLPKN
ncbi:MAG: VOC family protein [Bryobacteraceae bacterium]